MKYEGRDRIIAINKKSLKLIFFAGVTLYLGVFIFADVLLKVWLGDRFVDILPHTFRILLFTSFVSLIGVPSYYTHMGQGRIHLCLISHSILSVTNVVIVIVCAAISPEMIESRIYYAILLGQCGSTAYLIWQLNSVLYANKDYKDSNLSNVSIG